ncbi:UDP-N-acetylglucosamine 1-carboxyvinyltransferase [bacterium]|nr:UDP-N-acetylglucosamine 1-carboxyvinyltransferase [bacterium]
MDIMIIEGGHPLFGEVHISGAKNAALPVLAAALLTAGNSRITNLPKLRDVTTLFELLRLLGSRIEQDSRGSVFIETSKVCPCRVPYELVKTMRASALVLGPLVARFGRAEVALPGGCAIGARPIDLHLKGLQKLGVDIELDEGYVKAECQKMHGGHIVLDLPTVTGTENLMMAAALIDEDTIIENAAREPEVVNLADALKKMGSSVEGAGTGSIFIHGTRSPRPFDHRIIPDRIEAGTYMAATAIAGGKVKIKGCPQEFFTPVTEKLQDAGVTVRCLSDDIIEVEREQGMDIMPVDINTAPYPGFPTDMQAQFMALLSIARGVSLITENVFENRFMHVLELQRMGADIKLDGHTAIIKGVESLGGAPVMATDLRASACLILAGLAAKGKTTISRIYHLDRGYEGIEEKFGRLGAIIRREKEK